MRAQLEPRFGRDFAAVRVHDDDRAARSAAQIGAAAYSAGSHIVFGRGGWSPGTARGRHLIAHELAHVAQQPAPAGRQLALGRPSDPAEAAAQDAADRISTGSRVPALRPTERGIVRRQTGQSTYRDVVNQTSVQTTGDTTEGTVNRLELGTAQQLISDATARVRTRFSPAACEVSVPFDVRYEPVPTAADLSAAAGAAPLSALPPARSRALFDRFVRVVDEQLNGWFNVRIGACPDQACADRDIPITVRTREVTSNPQLTVVFVAGEGRSYVSADRTRMVLMGGDASDERVIAHEAAHGALGHGDEYFERGRPPERVRDRDMSRMNSHAYRQAVFHERHFAHVREFVSHVVNQGRSQPCTVTLRAVPRGLWDLRFEAQAGYASLGGAHGAYLSSGVNVGLLTRDSATRLSLGPQVTGIASPSGGYREAFLLGLRVGVEHRTALPRGGLSFGAHLEGGVGLTSGRISTTPGAPLPGATLPYVEGGGRLGYSTGLAPVVVSLFTEAAAGTSLDRNDPQALHYFRLGLGVSLSY